jgi:3-dehydroquinate dehydratase-1
MLSRPLARKFDSILKFRPLIVGTLTASDPLKTQLKHAKKARVDLIELRLDTFVRGGQPPRDITQVGQYLVSNIRSETSLPIILTLRGYKEAGKRIPPSKRLKDADRIKVIESLIKRVQLVDCEISAPQLSRPITKEAHLRRVGVIHSHHNFRKMPPRPHLNQLSRISRMLKGDFFKVAGIPKTEKELIRFLKWGMTSRHKRPVLIGMGPHGHMSRFLAYSFGSTLTYGHLGSQAAPGQPTVQALATSIRDIYRNRL